MTAYRPNKKTSRVRRLASRVASFFLLLTLDPGLWTLNVRDARAQVPARSVPVTCVRDDALSTLTPAEGQQVPCRIDAKGSIWVTLGTALSKDVDSIALYGSDGAFMRLVKTDGQGVILIREADGVQRGTPSFGRAGDLVHCALSGNFQFGGEGRAAPLGCDLWGNLRTRAYLSGERGAIAAVKFPGEAPSLGDSPVVVAPSPVPSLQCPYVKGFSQTASAVIVANPGGKFLHICAWSAISATAQSISLVQGTGSACATGTTALYGGAAASAALAANGGLAWPSDRVTLPMQRGGDDLCVLQSSTGNVSGTIVYGIF